MQQITLEWIDKAEADFATAEREVAVTDHPNYDGVCFHAQQCAEKYLKAFLQESNIAFPRIHDLADLLSLILPIEPTWISMQSGLNTLSAFAVGIVILANPRITTKQKRPYKSVKTFAVLSVTD